MSTYGDYSHVVIKRTVCPKCATPISCNLQRLLDQPELLCPPCLIMADKQPKRLVPRTRIIMHDTALCAAILAADLPVAGVRKRK